MAENNKNQTKKFIYVILLIISVILVIISLYRCFELYFTNKIVNEVYEFLEDKDSGYVNLGEVLENSIRYKSMEHFIDQYGSVEYGKVAQSLNDLGVCSMSFCIFIIWIGAFLNHKNIKIGKIIIVIGIIAFIIFQIIPIGYSIGIRNIRV